MFESAIMSGGQVLRVDKEAERILDANYRESCVGTYVEVGTRPKKKDHAAVLRQRDVRIRRFCITCGDVGSNRPHADDRA